jgi:hypothetical protein
MTDLARWNGPKRAGGRQYKRPRQFWLGPVRTKAKTAVARPRMAFSSYTPTE